MSVIVFATGAVGCAVTAVSEDVDVEDEASRIVPAGAAFLIVDPASLPKSDPMGWAIAGGVIVDHGYTPVPPQVPMWAAQAALKQAGEYDAINRAIAGWEASSDPSQIAAFFAWTMGNFASRGSSFIATLAAQIWNDPRSGRRRLHCCWKNLGRRRLSVATQLFI